jgi:arsenical pump membrane protein
MRAGRGLDFTPIGVRLAVLMLVLQNAAVPVLAIGVAAVLIRRLRPRVSVHILIGLFAHAVALDTLARRWDGPASLVARLGGVGAAVVGALSSVLVNNLPAAALLSAQRHRIRCRF